MNEALTMRDWQAMHNFSEEGICDETLAEHFRCSVEYVQEILTTRPWLRPTGSQVVVNLTWMESDHSDPLELVKLYYPQHVPKNISLEITAKEKRPEEMTYEDYLATVDYQEAYRNYGERYAEVIQETAQEIAARSGIELTFVD